MMNFFKSFPFHLKSAGVSLIRHFVMTLSASSAVMITCILLSAFLMIVGNVNGFADNIEGDIRIHVVLNDTIQEEEQIAQSKNEIEQISGVLEAEFSIKDNELKLWIEEKGEIFSIYEGEDNPLNHAFFVSVNDSERIETITNQIKELEMVDDAMYGGDSITDLISLLNTVRFGIVIFMTLLGLLAVFLISNTIKMAIYSRNNEIMIMRNVGATNLFIKIPFMIEGMIIGMIGAIIPCILTFFGYRYLFMAMNGQLFTNVFALQPIWPFTFEIMCILMIGGALVGLLGALISTTKYLHWRR